jgi:hypothetical protein
MSVHAQWTGPTGRRRSSPKRVRPLAADLDVEHAAAHAIPGLEHDDVATRVDELRRSSKPGDAGPADDDVRIEAPGHRARKPPSTGIRAPVT